MKLPRASMTTTLIIFSVLVVDIWVTSDLLLHDRGDLTIYGLGFMPMATALIFGFYRPWRLGHRSDSFTKGFVGAGLGISAVGLIAIQYVAIVRDVLNKFAQSLDDWLATAIPATSADTNKVLTISEWLTAAIILSLPTFLAALSGGFFSHWMELQEEAVERRERFPVSRRPRFTMGSAALLMSVLAIDFGLIRHLLVSELSFWKTFGIGFLPMANALVLGLPRMLKRHGHRHKFLIGFEVAGWLATASYLGTCAIAPNAVMRSLDSFARAVFSTTEFLLGSGPTHQIFTRSWFAGTTAEVVVVFIFFTLPPLLLALSGGAITRKFGRRLLRLV